MPVLAFENMTPEQALGISSADSVTISSGSASETTVLFLNDGNYSVTVADRTLIFGPQFRNLNGSRLTYEDGSKLFVGSTGGDSKTFAEPSGFGAMYGGGGNDSLTGSHGDWLMQGNQGDDKIVVYADYANTIYGGQDDDVVSLVFSGPSAAQFVQGNKGRDTIQGGEASDTLLGGQGDDIINGGGGQDFLNGNLGNDQIEGGGRLFGEGGDDHILTLGGIDSTVSGGDGDDDIVLGSVEGAVTHNVAYGDMGDDTISSLTSATGEVHGGDGGDLIHVIQDLTFGVGAYGRLLDGGGGDDTIVARNGADAVKGGEGADSLSGGADNDTIDGGAGADTLSGGDGVDLFTFAEPSASLSADGADRIVGWDIGDHIELPGPAIGYAEATAADFEAALTLARDQMAAGAVEVLAVQVGSDVVVFADATDANGPDTAIMLVGRALADISADNFT